jgi:hypothetical protein
MCLDGEQSVTIEEEDFEDLEQQQNMVDGNWQMSLIMLIPIHFLIIAICMHVSKWESKGFSRVYNFPS